jgi:hypothetical protein
MNRDKAKIFAVKLKGFIMAGVVDVFNLGMNPCMIRVKLQGQINFPGPV